MSKKIPPSSVFLKCLHMDVYFNVSFLVIFCLFWEILREKEYASQVFCIQPDQAPHQTTSENKEVYSCQRPCMCQPTPKSCAFCSHSTALLQCASPAALGCTELQPAPAPRGQQSAGLTQLHFSNFPCYRQAAGCCCVREQARERKERSCKWCIVLLRACCIIFAAQGRDKMGNPSVSSGLSIKSPSSFARFFTVYLCTKCCCLSALLPLPPTLLESPVLPREMAATTRETELPCSSAASPEQPRTGLAVAERNKALICTQKKGLQKQDDIPV